MLYTSYPSSHKSSPYAPSLPPIQYKSATGGQKLPENFKYEDPQPWAMSLRGRPTSRQTTPLPPISRPGGIKKPAHQHGGYHQQASQPLPKIERPTAFQCISTDTNMELEAEPPKPLPKKTETTALDLVGSSYDGLIFKQRNTGNCYLLAGLDAVLHSLSGAKLLKKIKIEEMPPDEEAMIGKTYTVRFPSGKSAQFEEREIGLEKVGKKPLEGPKSLQFLELAYSKATRSERNRRRDNPFANEGRGHSPIIMESGIAKDALYDIFGGEQAEVTCEDLQHPTIKNTDPFERNPEGHQKLVAFLRNIEKDTAHEYLLAGSTAAKSDTEDTIDLPQRRGFTTVHKTFPRSHAYSIRGFDLDKSTITLANPHDTSKSETLTLSEFCKVFWRISGIKVKKTDL